MERAYDIFEKITKGGIESINGFIITRKSEELFIDFKRSADDGKGFTLNNKDRENLSKAISGFGNSEGGILIWGVDCSKCTDNADVANAKVPIQNAQRFLSWIENVISGCTIPPHTEVRNALILENGTDDGYIVTYIPKSNNSPHQVVGSSRYYIRAGSNFVPTPHAVLAGLFGKRPQPEIIYQFLYDTSKKVNNSLPISFLFVIRNIGQSIARDIYLNATAWGKPSENSTIAFEIKDQINWEGHFLLGLEISILTKPGIRLAPQSSHTPLLTKLNLIPPFDTDLKIEFNYGCENGIPKYYQIELRIDELNALYFEASKPQETNEFKRLIDRLFSGTQ